ncbi:MAG: Gfo/Idh/MocA family oxidoreductase [Armatimonadota bacterium]
MFGPDETIRIGMIGSGGNARGHMRSLLAVENVKIAAIADPSDEAVEAALELDDMSPDAGTFSDYEEMLSSVDLDAVVISTPHTLHYEQIMTAFDRDLHVLCEKPMVCTVEEAESVIERIEQTGLVFGIGYQRHLQAPYRYCREKIAGGEVGGCHFVSSVQSQNWYRRQVGNDTWRAKMQWSGGGQLNDSGSHLLDVVLWILDADPVEAFAYQENLEAEVDILSAISVRFENDALCNFSVVGHAVNFYESITFFCENATLGIHGDEVWYWEDEHKQVISGADLGRTWNKDANFIAALRGEEEIQAPAECGLRVIQLSEAIWASAERGRPVIVPRSG